MYVTTFKAAHNPAFEVYGYPRKKLGRHFSPNLFTAPSLVPNRNALDFLKSNSLIRELKRGQGIFAYPLGHVGVNQMNEIVWTQNHPAVRFMSPSGLKRTLCAIIGCTHEWFHYSSWIFSSLGSPTRNSHAHIHTQGVCMPVVRFKVVVPSTAGIPQSITCCSTF